MNLLKNLSGFGALLISLSMASAQPTGEAMFNFDVSNAPAWDLTGSYQLDTPVLGAGNSEVPLSYAVPMTHDPRGQLRGDGNVMVKIGSDTVAANYTLRGSVSTGGGVARASFTVTLRGNDAISGAIRSFNIKATYKLEVDPKDLTLNGSVSGSLSISGGGGGSIHSDTCVLPLPPGVDGSWYAQLTFLPLKKLSGTGYVVVDSANSNLDPFQTGQRVLQMSLSGSYSAKNNLSKVSMKGVNEGKGTSLKVNWFGENTLDSMDGKVLGQKVRFDAMP